MGDREKLIVGVLAGLLLIGVILRFSGVFSGTQEALPLEGGTVSREESSDASSVDAVGDNYEGENEGLQEEETIKVHIVGEVSSPGVYDLPEGAIVKDAVEKAGGATQEALPEGVNLARPLINGEQVVIPAVRGEEDENTPVEAVSGSVGVGDSRVNINHASASELESLNGIGEKRAQSIVDYREENGPFQDTEGLMDVPNIGSGILEGVEEDITVY